MQLLQQITLKLNNFKASKTVTDSNTGQQQLVMTQDEYDQMKRLMEIQNKLQNEIKQEVTNISTTTNNNSTSTNYTTTTNNNISSIDSNPSTNLLVQQTLAEKYKMNEIIKQQLDQIKLKLAQSKLGTANANTQNQSSINNLSSDSSSEFQNQQQTYVALVKKQTEIQQQIAQLEQNTSSKILVATTSHNNIIVNGGVGGAQQEIYLNGITANQIRQTPVKIRNVITGSPAPASPVTTVSTTATIIKTGQNTTPLRTLVINSNNANSPIIATTTAATATLTNTLQSTSSVAAQSLNIPTILPLQYAVNLHKQFFPHVQFKCLNFEELAQNSVITKQTDELTFVLLRQLDERAATVINQEQKEAFAKNQIKLVKKYLEQQLLLKNTIKTRISEQLSKDQKLVLEPDFKTPFADKTEAIKRLSRYHVLQKTYHEPTEEESQKCNKINFNCSFFRVLKVQTHKIGIGHFLLSQFLVLIQKKLKFFVFIA
jgi:hypothetical protein